MTSLESNVVSIDQTEGGSRLNSCSGRQNLNMFDTSEVRYSPAVFSYSFAFILKVQPQDCKCHLLPITVMFKAVSLSLYISL